MFSRDSLQQYGFAYGLKLIQGYRVSPCNRGLACLRAKKKQVCVFVPQKLPLSPAGQRGQTCLLLPVVAKGEMNQEVASHLIKSSFDYGNDNKRQRIAGS
jgi:hypothetical protein